jgi:hypothetical protein
MFGTTNTVSMKRTFTVHEIFDSTTGEIELRPDNNGQGNCADLYVDGKFVMCIPSDMGDKLLEMLIEMKD